MGIKDNWDAQRHIDYILELQNNGNADIIQLLLVYTGRLAESIEVLITLSTLSVIKFGVKSINEKKREYLDQHWREILDDLIIKIEDNKQINDEYIETLLPQLKHYDHDSVEALQKIHDKYKSSRKSYPIRSGLILITHANPARQSGPVRL